MEITRQQILDGFPSKIIQFSGTVHHTLQTEGIVVCNRALEVGIPERERCVEMR